MTNEAVKQILKTVHGINIVDVSRMWLQRKLQLLGHIIRADPQDPMRQVVFQPNSLIPRTEHTRRVDRPRAHWLGETYADAFREFGNQEHFDIQNAETSKLG